MKSASSFPTKSPFEVGLTISTPTREVAAETFNDLLVEFELSNGIESDQPKQAYQCLMFCLDSIQVLYSICYFDLSSASP
ncbi:Uncharacterised protein [Acinetobacter baumannii]|nr:Uncharacterised protein [Acinetobacter baumannii]